MGETSCGKSEICPGTCCKASQDMLARAPYENSNILLSNDTINGSSEFLRLLVRAMKFVTILVQSSVEQSNWCAGNWLFDDAFRFLLVCFVDLHRWRRVEVVFKVSQSITLAIPVSVLSRVGGIV